MTMRVRMLQTRQGDGGQLLLKDGTYTVTDELGAVLRGMGFAVDVDDRFGVPANDAPTGPTTAAGGVYTVEDGTQDVVIAGGGQSLQLDIPAGVSARLNIVNDAAGASSDISYIPRSQPALRFSTSGTEVTLPSVNLDRTAGVGWTLMVLGRISAETVQAGSIHTPFLRIDGPTSFHAELGYEGVNATAQRCLKFLMPNAANSAQVAVRFGQNAAGSPFVGSRLGQWGWWGVRQHSGALTENVIGANGVAADVTFASNTITLFWVPLTQAVPLGTTVFAANTALGGGAAASSVTSCSNPLRARIGTSAGGSFDIARVLFLSQTATAAQIKQLAACKRPGQIGMTVDPSKDLYYVLNALSAAQLLDELGGTAATSATFAGTDGLTPEADLPIGTRSDAVREPVGTVSSGELKVLIVDGSVKRAF